MANEKQDDEIELPVQLGQLASLIEKKPEALACEDNDLRDAALVAAKFIFDLTLKSESRAQPHLKELLHSIEPEVGPQTRAQVHSTDRTEKKKRSASGHSILNETPLPSLLIEGMDDEQVWAQLDLKAKNVCQTLEDTFDAGDMDARGMRGVSESEDDEEEDDELDSDEIDELQNMEGMKEGEWTLDDDEDEDDVEDEDIALSASDEDEEVGETFTELRDPSSEEDTSDEERTMDLDARPSPGRTPSRKKHGKKHAELDDGFFNLADFNAEIEEAEAKSVSRGFLSKDSDDEESGDDNDLDLFVPVVDESPLEEGLGEAGGDTYYKDFFDAPSRSVRPTKRKAPASSSEPTRSSKVHFNEQVKVKQIKSKGKGRSLSSVDLWTGEDVHEDDEDDDSLGDVSYLEEGAESEEIETDGEFGSESLGNDIDQGREAIERLKDDLFADDGDEDHAPKKGLSTHEARMEAIRKQIAELEAENVGEKDWVLKGEVSSRARPQNALLEEDLEFEHVSKAVPVVTDEVVHDLEARIKARVIEGRFDDVVRKRPVDDKPFLPSRVFELQDTKSKESLAQIYENEYIATQSGGVTDDRDAKLQKEHEDIERQWESICYKLDALCNAHFTPKQPKATISTISNVSAVSLESPLPTAKTASTVLAPEELFAPSASNSRSKSELTPPEKQALRMKERKKRKKQREQMETSVDKFAKSKGMKSVKKQKEAALKSVVKTGKGVTVIGKKSQSTTSSAKKGKRQNS